MNLQGTIRAVCVSPEKGTVKRPADSAVLVRDFGIEHDAHAGKWHRQVSLLSYERVEEFNRLGGGVTDGDFGENLLVEGIDLKALPVGTILLAVAALIYVVKYSFYLLNSLNGLRNWLRLSEQKA